METTAFEAFQYFLDLGQYESATVMIHGFDPDDLTAMVIEGRLGNLRREKRSADYSGRPPNYYLVGDVKVDGIKFTLFSEDIPVSAPLEAVS